MKTKIIALLILTGLTSASTFAQLTGIKNIPGDYSTMAAAIAALNTQGVGPGGVTFNLAAGYTETFVNPTDGLITVENSLSTKPIVFQKSGTGTNPKITPAMGVGYYDYVFCIGGTDYVTFDGIDMQEDPANGDVTTQAEYGFVLAKSATDTSGVQHATIKNCTISLERTNTGTVGIILRNWKCTAPGVILSTINDPRKSNSYNSFQGNTITNCFTGMYLYGSSSLAPYLFYDQDNDIGSVAGNTITNFGSTTGTCYGIYAQYENNLTVANNTFTSTVEGGTCNVMEFQATANASVSIYGNTITVHFNGTGTFYGIKDWMGTTNSSNTILVHDNIVTGCTFPNATFSTCSYINIGHGAVNISFYNNSVTNNTYGSISKTATGQVTYISVNAQPVVKGTADCYNNTVSNNTRIQSVVGGGSTTYLHFSHWSNTINVYGNTVDNNTVATNGITYGIWMPQGIGTKNVYGNSITNLHNANGTTYGIYIDGGSEINLYKNKVLNINATGNNSTIAGYYLGNMTTAGNIFISNNFSGDLKAPNTSSVAAVKGIWAYGGNSNYIGLYNNTVFIDASSSGANFGTTGIHASQAAKVYDIRNNILVNTSIPKGTGRTVALLTDSVTFGNLALLSNNNNYYVGTPSGQRLIFSDGVTNLQTMQEYRSAFYPKEYNSVSENPPFISTASPVNLHLDTTIPTQCESGGVEVVFPIVITDDVDGHPRFPNAGYPVHPNYPATAPDIGADEFGGIPSDLTPPFIAYAPFANVATTSDRTLTATITDAHGVPTSGIGLPRVCWKKNYNGSWTYVTGLSTGNNQYTFTFGGGGALGDTIHYYVVAQDSWNIPNVGSNPMPGAGGFSASPPAASIAPATPNKYIIVPPICGTFTVGTGGNYPTLTAAINDVNAKGITCPVTLVLISNSYTSETYPITLNPNGGSSAANTLTIKPASGVHPVFAAVSASNGIFKINGFDYLVIDGSASGGSDKNLTFRNASETGGAYTLGLFNAGGNHPASHIVIKNSIIRGFSSTTIENCAIFLSPVGAGYHDIVITGDSIYGANTGIRYTGTFGGVNLNGQITGNVIGSEIPERYITTKGIVLSYSDNTLIEGNNIMGAANGNSVPTHAGIYILGGSTNTKIRRNLIHDFFRRVDDGSGAYGIWYESGSSTVTEISSNSIYGIKSSGAAPGASPNNPYGIFIKTGGNIKILHNSIWLYGNLLSPTGMHDASSACIGIFQGGSLTNNIEVRNNILANTMLGLSVSMGCPATGRAYAIMTTASNASNFSLINYNDYHVNGCSPTIGFMNFNNMITLAEWQAATLQDQHSKSIDPQFTSPSNLVPTITTIPKAGIYIPLVPYDLNGISRTNPPDLGAYEFTPTSIVNTLAASVITQNGALLNGNANATGTSIAVFFDWGLTPAYGSSVAATPPTITGNTLLPMNTPLTGLTPGTTYHFRARGISSAGITIYGNDMTFTTVNAPPLVVTTAATAIAGDGATLNGTVNANNLPSTVTFEYGLTTAYGSTVNAIPNNVTGTAVTPVSAMISGLLPNTVYHFRAVAVSSSGTTYGNDMTFNSATVPATVVTNLASNVGGNNATLNGTVTANNAPTTVTFEWGLTNAYGNTVNGSPASVTGITPTAVMAGLTGLLPNATYHFRCVGTNGSGTTYGFDQTFTTNCIAPVITIAGPATACAPSGGHVYSTQPGNTNYMWTVSAGGIITSGSGTNTITVTWNTPGAQTISVNYQNPYGCSASTPVVYNVTVTSLPPPVISGPATVCAGSATNNYTTQAGMNAYAWTVSAGGTITAGAGTNAITVTWNTAGAHSVSVNYANASGCTAPAPGVYSVTVNAASTPVISGPASACAASVNNTYTTQAGMTGYTWSLSAGGTITAGAGTNAITVTWNSAGAQTVSVNYANASGCTALAPVSFPVIVNPLPAPTITGPNSVCANSGFQSYSTEAGQTGYTWTVSAGGTIVSGQGTSAVQVNWTTAGAQSVSVNYANAFGCFAAAPSVFNVTVNGAPAAAGPVTGTSAVCGGAMGVAYSCAPISGATYYVWNLPAGATIASGAGTTNITVDFAANASSGDITVLGNNLCGNGTASPNFPVTVNALPAAAGPITGPASVCQGAMGVSYSVAAIANSTSYQWTFPMGVTIASGATTNQVTVNFPGGALSGDITVKGVNACGNGQASPALAVTVNAIPAAPVVTANGNILTSSAPAGNQWYYDNTGAIPGATGQTYTVANNTGWYWCTVTLNGCTSPISNKVYVVVTGTPELSAGPQVNIYPVPNNGQFSIAITSSTEMTYQLEIYNTIGSRIYYNETRVAGTTVIPVELSQIAGGVYTVVLRNTFSQVVRRIIINH